MGLWDSTKKFLFGGGATEGLDTAAPNTDYAQGYLRRQLDGMGQRTAPMAQATQLGQAAQLDPTQQAQVRADQRSAAGFLQGIMSGQRAGAGELAVNRQVSGANAAQQAAARMARGSGAALAGRNAMRNQADIGLMGAGQAAQAQAADQAQAVGQLGGILAQTRAGDLDLAGQNAQFQQQRMLQQGAFGQQANLANQDAQLRMMSMNDAATAGYLQQLTGLDQAAWMRELQKRQLAMGDKGALPGLLQAGGTAIGALYGGPAGAQAGGKIGAAAGGGGDTALMYPRY